MSLLPAESDDIFASVSWDTPAASTPVAAASAPAPKVTSPTLPAVAEAQEAGDTWLRVAVVDPVLELRGQRGEFVSFLVVSQSNMVIMPAKSSRVRRRFKDFAFLHTYLTSDFAGCAVPALPGKARLEYVAGDRFADDFLEKRRGGLARFLRRVARHPILRRATLLREFLYSTEWNIQMHKHAQLAPSPHAQAGGVLDQFSDSLVNAFSKPRKQDSRFTDVRESLTRSTDALAAIQKGISKLAHTSTELSVDYAEAAESLAGLAYLESGIADPLNKFAHCHLRFSELLQLPATSTPIAPDYSTDDESLAALEAYAQVQKEVLKLREKKQLDFEALTAYLSDLIVERDRLSNGGNPSTGVGISGYFKQRIDAVRVGSVSGVEAEHSRQIKIEKLNRDIEMLQKEVHASHDTSNAFSEQVLAEYAVWQAAKQQELKLILMSIAKQHIDMYERAVKEWDVIKPIMEKIRVDI